MISCTKVFGFAWGLVACFLWLCASAAAETLTPDQVRDAMQSERSKIMSGRLVANGRFKVVGHPQLSGKGSIVWKHEFDYADDYFLFDRSEPRDPASKLPAADNDRLRTFFAEDRLMSYAYQDRNTHDSALRVYERNNLETTPSNQFRRLSVRGIGFYNYSGIVSVSERGDRLFFEHPYVSKRGSKIKVKQESEDILQLWYKHPDDPEGPDAVCLWVDKSKGFIPVRKASITNGVLGSDSRTEWKTIDQVWVPTRLSGRSRTPYGAEEHEYWTEEFELDITWESLNQSIGTGKLHDFREFNLPESTRVFQGKKLVHIYGRELPFWLLP